MRRCVACGEPVKHHTSQTCGDPFCLAVLHCNPDLRVQRRGADRRRKWEPRGHPERRRPPILRLLPEELEVGARIAVELRVEQEFEVDSMGDPRGRGRPESQADVWGYLSRKVVCLRVIGQEGGKAALVVRRKRREHVAALVRQRLAVQVFDVFMAWRCGCPHGHEKIYERPEDLPQEDGYWEACPVCGAAPIEVIIDD